MIVSPRPLPAPWRHDASIDRVHDWRYELVSSFLYCSIAAITDIQPCAIFSESDDESGFSGSIDNRVPAPRQPQKLSRDRDPSPFDTNTRSACISIITDQCNSHATIQPVFRFGSVTAASLVRSDRRRFFIAYQKRIRLLTLSPVA